MSNESHPIGSQANGYESVTLTSSRQQSESRRVRMSGQERRSQLLDVGREVFAERGFEGASIEEIAQRANITKPVVYEHFGGKEGLYAVIVDREVQQLLQRVTHALNADHPRLLLEQAALALLSLINDIASQVEHIFAEEFTNRGYDAAMAPLYSQALVGMVANVGLWWLDAGTPTLDEVAAHLVNLAWNGLRDLNPAPRLQISGDGR